MRNGSIMDNIKQMAAGDFLRLQSGEYGIDTIRVDHVTKEEASVRIAPPITVTFKNMYAVKPGKYRRNINITISGELKRFRQTLKDKDTTQSRHHKYLKRLEKYWKRGKTGA